jgi:hypothetical protein
MRRGLDRIREACRAAGTPEPEVTYDGSGVIVEFRFPPEHVALGAGATAEAATPPVAPPVTPPVALPVITLLRTLANGPLGNTQLRAHLGLRDRTHVRTHYVAPALAAGLVELTIPGKPSSRLQQYRLTVAGRAALAADTTSS